MGEISSSSNAMSDETTSVQGTIADHVGTAPLSCPGEHRSPVVPLVRPTPRSRTVAGGLALGQPRAAVPTRTLLPVLLLDLDGQPLDFLIERGKWDVEAFRRFG